MGATFPSGIVSFTEKKDNVDVNHAADINRLQDEVVAIEAALGPLFTVVDELQTEVDGEQDQITSLANTEKTDFANLSTLINQLWTGQNIRCSELILPGPVNIAAYTQNFQTTVPNSVILAPYGGSDPAGLYNRTTGGVTLNASGFWILSGFVRYDIVDKNGAGVYQAALKMQNQWARGMDRTIIEGTQVNGVWPNVLLNPSRMGWFPAGTTVTLGSSHNALATQSLTTAFLSAVLLRQG